jgi:hypothetical protein
MEFVFTELPKLPEYTIEIHDSYASWNIKDEYNNIVELNIHPYNEKLVNGDKFYYDTGGGGGGGCGKIIVSHSILKNQVIPGILIIDSNKTYGRNAKGKLLYKFIPNNNTFPHFLVQYELKNVGLAKTHSNLYVIVEFISWENKHPNGIIAQLIGNCDTAEHFYEYQVYVKKLHSSTQPLNKHILNITNLKSNKFNYDDTLKLVAQKYNIIHYRSPKEYYIFTIDNLNTIHYDDAISIIKDTTSQNTFIITVYITNTALWLDYYNLWEHLTGTGTGADIGGFKRVANIYLPHKKINMLPSIFIDTFLNLKENTTRLALAFDITIQEGNVIKVQPTTCIIHINKNYAYNEPQLSANKNYKLINTVVKTMDNMENIKALESGNNDSRKLIEYLMIIVNNYCAKQLFTSTECSPLKGIFKIYIPNTNTHPQTHFLKNIDNHYISKIHEKMNAQFVSSSYCFLHKITNPYLNITSPLRKLTDTINLCVFQNMNAMFYFTEQFQTFYSFWINNLNYINAYFKYSKKIQNKCQLLNRCIQNPEEIYSGIIVEILPQIEDRHKQHYKYVVYFKTIHLFSKFITIHMYDVGYIGTFKLYVFINELNLKKKIRILHT